MTWHLKIFEIPFLYIKQYAVKKLLKNAKQTLSTRFCEILNDKLGTINVFSVIQKLCQSPKAFLLKSPCYKCGCFAGEKGAKREHKTSLHAIRSILRNEGIRGIYTG